MMCHTFHLVRFLVWLPLMLLAALLPLPAMADTFEWTNPLSGVYTNSGNWTNITGADSAPPDAGDTALFNEAGAYSVTLVTTQVDSDVLQVSAGTVTFREAVIGAGSYNLVTGAADARIDGGTLILGVFNSRFILNIGDDLVVQQGGTLQVLFNSDVDVDGSLSLGTNGEGTILVSDSGSTLDVATGSTIGLSGFTGTLTTQSGSQGNVLDGTTNIAVSSVNNSSGFLNVLSNSTLQTSTLNIGTTSSSTATGQSAVVSIDGAGSTLSMAGSSTLSVGSTANNNVVAQVNVSNDGTLATGTGLTTIRNTAIVTNDGGTVNFGGDVLIDGGTYQENQSSDATRTFADDASIVIQNGGTLTLNDNFLLAERGQSVVIDGSSSQIQFDSAFTVVQVGGFSDSSDSSFTLQNNANLTVSAFTMRASTAGQSATLNILSGADLNVDDSSQFSILGSDTFANNVEINVDGAGSDLRLINVFSPLQLGRTSGTGLQATMNLTNGGDFTSDDEGLEIYEMGVVNLDDGRLFMFGDVLVRGGQINTLAGAGVVQLENFAELDFRVTEGGSVSLRQNIFELAANRLIVEGTGSTFTTDSSAVDSGQVWLGSSPGSAPAVLTMRHQATLDIGTLNLSSQTRQANVTNSVDISDGATVTVNHLGVGVHIFDDGAGFFDTTQFEPGVVTIDGPGSRLSIRTGYQAHIGSPEDDATETGVHGTVNLVAGGLLDTTLGTLHINRQGIINIDGGTLNAGTIVHDSRSEVNFTAGTISFTGSLTVDNNQLLGPTIDLSSGKHLAMTGNTTVSSNGTLTLNGGSLTAANLVVQSGGTFAFNSGSLSLSSASLTVADGGLLGSDLSLPSGKSITLVGDVFIEAEGQVDLAGGSLGGDNLELRGQLIYNGGTLNINSLIDISNSGRLFVSAGRTLTTSVAIDNGGRVEMFGGGTRIQGSGSFNNAGLLSGEGEIATSLTNFSSGEIRVSAGDTLSITGTMSPNAGRINLQGGFFEVNQSITNGATGDIVGRGTFSTSGLTNLGDIALSAGVTDVFGDVDNQSTGRVIVSGNADVIFWDDVDHTGALFNVATNSSATFFGTAGFGITGGGDVYFEADVTPGSSPGLETFGGRVHLGALARLDIELAGTTRGTQYDALDIASTASLGGTLDVTLLGGFLPVLGDRFDILTATNGVSGTFNALSLPSFAPLLSLAVVYEANTVSLVTTTLLPGDYNVDGQVDAADYTVWRDTLGSTTLLAADGDLSGTIDAADYELWRSNFGSVAPATLATGATVPEPTTLFILAMIGAVVIAQLSSSRVSFPGQ